MAYTVEDASKKLVELASQCNVIYHDIMAMPYSEIVMERSENAHIEKIEQTAQALTEFAKFLKRQNRGRK